MKINVRNLVNRIMLVQIGWVLFAGLLSSYFPKIEILSYIPDVLNILLLLLIANRSKHNLTIEHFFILLFAIYAIFSALWGDGNWYYVISSGRRYLSAFIVYYTASEYISVLYWEKVLNLCLFAQGVNVIFTAYQNLVMKLHPDFCNGIFGFTLYNNALQGIFCLIISIVAIVYFLDRKWSKKKTIYAIGTSCLICAFSEIKAYYVLLIMALFVALLFRTNNVKTIKRVFNLIFIGIVLLLVAYKVLELVFPANLQTFFNLSQYILYEQYGARGGAGRLTTISYIYSTVFKRNIWNTLIGSGLGGVATEYAYTIGKLFVSFGVIGLLLLSIWLIYICLKYWRSAKSNSQNLILIIMATMIVVTLFVWNALFTQAVFLIFWVMGACGLGDRKYKIGLLTNGERKNDK